MRKIVLELILILITAFCVSFFWQREVVLVLLLLLETALIGIFWRERFDFLWFSTAAVIGPLGEAVIIAHGAWSYAKPVVFGVPIWLPVLWGVAGLLGKRLVISVSELFD